MEEFISHVLAFLFVVWVVCILVGAPLAALFQTWKRDGD